MEITYLKNKDIDLLQWDKCIEKSVNGNIYGFSWYLNILAEHWDALVAGNYEAVMPLVKTRGKNSRILVQPYFGRQLGLYSRKILTNFMVNDFIGAIPKKYKHIQFNLNKYNEIDNYSNGINVSHEKIFSLDLIQPYSKIRQRFSPSILKRINNADKESVVVLRGLLPNDLLSLYARFEKPHVNVTGEDFEKLRKIISHAIRYRMGEIYGAYSLVNNFCGGIFLISSHQKLILLFTALSDEGIENHSLYKLMDHVIRTYSEKNITLVLDNVNGGFKNDLFKGFGAKEFTFPRIKIDRLPWYTRPFMKNIR
jgi:hypothetical protein